MQRLSKAFYLGSIIGGMGLAILIFGAAVAIMQMEEAEIGAGLMVVGYLPLIYGVVVLCILVYKMWDAIQAGGVRTTPGKAVGFLFIPFFNFYWIFQAYWGWTKDYNKYASQLGVNVRAPEGIALAICILAVAGVVPVLGICTGLVNTVLMFVFFNSVIDCVNALADAGDTGVSATDSYFEERTV